MAGYTPHFGEICSLATLVIANILCADETRLALLADVVQVCGLLLLTEELTVPPRQRPQGTVHPLRLSGADRP